MERARRRRLPWVAGGALVALVMIAVAAFLVYRAWYGQTPPPAPAQPGVVRLTNPYTGGGVPPPEHRAVLPDGQPVLLALRYIDGSGGSAKAHLAIVLPPAPTRFVALGRGQAASVPGATIRVLDIHQEPDPTRDAVDVLVTAHG